MMIQGCIAIYGGYFGGGIGFLMLATLTIAGQQIRAATATKNMLAMAMNASATLIFAFSGMISWPAALALCVGGIAGGLIGSWLIYRLPPQFMRIFVVCVGTVLTIYMFMRRSPQGLQDRAVGAVVAVAAFGQRAQGVAHFRQFENALVQFIHMV